MLDKSIVFTDELTTYDGLSRMGYDHRRIHHASKVYVMGDVHANTIEGFWTLTKRGMDGIHYAVGAKYLPDYLNEYSFRYNRRDQEESMFETLLDRVSAAAKAY